jgi:sodium pump decarboxylase gamma subunit
MANALLISMFGMGLVFLAIILLWGLMALLVRLTREPAVAEVEAEAALEPPAPSPELLYERKRRAAAIGAAVALSLHKSELAKKSSATPPVSVSAWQAVHRAGQLSQRGNFARKKGAR